MPALTLNGITLPIRYRSFGEDEPLRIGESVRARSAQMRESFRGYRRTWSAELKPQPKADTLAFRKLLSGDGHAFSFDASLYSSKGLGPSSSAGATQSATGGRFGGKLTLAATTGTITWSALAGAAAWSASVFRANGTAWDWYVVRSDGAKFLNGARNDAAATDWLTVSAGGAITLAQTAAVEQAYDDLVTLPYLMPLGWPAQIYAAAQAWGATPEGLLLAGDLIDDSPARVLAELGATQHERTGAGPYTSLAFRLIEV